MHHSPSRLLKHVDLVAGTVWVRQHQPRPYDVKGSIDVHRVGVLKADRMHPNTARRQVALHPLYPHEVSHLCDHDETIYHTEFRAYTPLHYSREKLDRKHSIYCHTRTRNMSSVRLFNNVWVRLSIAWAVHIII